MGFMGLPNRGGVLEIGAALTYLVEFPGQIQTGHETVGLTVGGNRGAYGAWWGKVGWV